MGRTQGAQSWLKITERGGKSVRIADGAMSPDGRVWGCYLHGIFSNRDFRRAWLRSLGWHPPSLPSVTPDELASAFDRLADEVAAALDMETLDTLIQNQV